MKIRVYWWKCPNCKSQIGTPTPGPVFCNNCGKKMKRKRLKNL